MFCLFPILLLCPPLLAGTPDDQFDHIRDIGLGEPGIHVELSIETVELLSKRLSAIRTKTRISPLRLRLDSVLMLHG